MSRFKYYCGSASLSSEEQHRVADALADDLITNEWETLEAHLEYHAAQGFYRSEEMWQMLSRARKRVGLVFLYPLPDAIVHALLDTGE